jgi:hypothetical protein
VGVGGGLAALKRASDQAYVEPRRMSLVQKRYSVVIRADEALGILVFKTNGYGPLIELGIWSLSANSHFGP